MATTIGDLGIVRSSSWRLPNRDLGIVTSADTDIPRTQQRRSVDTAKTFRGHSKDVPRTGCGRSVDRAQPIDGQGAGDPWLAMREFTGFCNGILQNSSDCSKLLVLCNVNASNAI